MSASPDESWKTQPPYRRPDEPTAENTPFDKKIHGSCHCGRVEYWLSRDEPLASKLCHCNTCKLIHGAPCQWAAIFSKSDMSFSHGAEGLRFYHAPSRRAEHALPCKVSCLYCGTLIMDEGRNMVLLFPPLLEMEDSARREKFQIQCHIFYPERIVDIPDGKPKWQTLDGKGEPLDLP